MENCPDTQKAEWPDIWNWQWQYQNTDNCSNIIGCSNDMDCDLFIDDDAVSYDNPSSVCLVH